MLKLRVTARLMAPSGVSKAAACEGLVTVALRRGARRVATKTATIKHDCTVRFKGTLRRSAIGSVRRVGVEITFDGNKLLAPVGHRKATLRINRGSWQ